MSNNIFETFTPKNPIVKKYVDYYYLDVKPDNKVHAFLCFPHVNNTLSLYQSHTRLQTGEMIFIKGAKPYQIFTPIRQKVLHVKQSGKVYRVVIVFRPLGIQQFYTSLPFSRFITDFDFFTPTELEQLFATTATAELTRLLDFFLATRFRQFDHILIAKCIDLIVNHYEDFSVSSTAKEIGVSRQHLNREFQLHLGISVKKFHEIFLFRQTIQKKVFTNTAESLTQLAYEFNFADQSHLNKTYKILTTNSPKTFFKKGTLLGKEDTFWHLLS